MPEDNGCALPVEQRLPLRRLDDLHPSLIPLDQLAQACDLRTQPRSGPGGQHRNRTSSGVFLYHPPTGITAEATERRSQASNRKIALRRLRLCLAIEIRTPSELESATLPAADHQLRQQSYRTPLRLAEDNDARPAVLALLLNDLHACGGQIRTVADHWQVSSSAIVRLLKTCREAFTLLNKIRDHHGHSALR